MIGDRFVWRVEVEGCGVVSQSSDVDIWVLGRRGDA
jgi:hypothetical protein